MRGNPAESRQYRKIERNLAYSPGNTEYETVVASGVFILEGCGSEKEEKGEEAACIAKSSKVWTRQYKQPRNQLTTCYYFQQKTLN